MSEISLYPQGIDIFTGKIDTTDGSDGDYIMAEHMNKVQNAILALEQTVGTNPQGSFSTLTQRLADMSQSSILTLPKIAIYNGNPNNANGAGSKEDAANYFSYLSKVMLDGINVFTQSDVISGIIEETHKLIPTDFYGTIDAGISTSNISLAIVGSTMDSWKTTGVKGIYFKNFGYDFLVNRERQNALIELAHDRDLNVIVSATDVDHVFSLDNILSMNPNNVDTYMSPRDGYLAIDYATRGTYYQNEAELKSLSSKMIAYRSAYGVSIYGLATISDTDANIVASKFYYAQACAMLYSLDGFYATSTVSVSETVNLYRSFPIVGKYYDSSPIVHANGSVCSRMSSVGQISVDMSAHTYSFKHIKIPLSLIDIAGDTGTIDASKLSGTMSPNVSINVIGRINSDASGQTISSSKVDVDGSKVINAINMIAGGSLKISSNAISNLSVDHIEDIVMQALADQLEAELNSGTLTANFRKLMAEYISAQNAYFTTIVSETGSFSGLNAGVITAGYLKSDLIGTNSIVSDKLSIYANGGLNKWNGTVVQKIPGPITQPGPVDIYGKDTYRRFEAVDSNNLVASNYIGGGVQNYIVLWETNVYCTQPFNLVTNFTANSNATIRVEGVVLTSVTANQTKSYTMSLHEGWNVVQVYQDHNTETTCSCDIGIKFSNYARQTETLKDSNGQPAEATPIARVDAYSSRSTQITGDIVKTGTIDATKIVSDSITAQQIAAHTITGEELAAGTITTEHLNADEVSAGLISAGMLQAIEAYIQHLTATDGEFENLLAELLTTKFLDTSNIKVVSEANDGTNTGSLVIDNGGLVVASVPKTKVSASDEVMTHYSGYAYRVIPKYVDMPICEQPAPSFALRDKTTLSVAQLTRDQYAIIYEYGQITLNEDIDASNKDVIATYSYPEQYFPTGSRVVKIDREGIKISSDGGRPGTWQTKLDGSRLYVGEADISEASITNAHIKEGTIQTANIGEAQITNALIHDVSADKMTAGTLTATNLMQIQGGNVLINNLGLTVSGGAGIKINTTGGKVITLDSAGLISDNFSIGANGDVSISGVLTAITGSKIANWNIGTDTIYDNGNKLVLDSSVPSISVDGGKVILGRYDATHYGIKATSGLIGNMSIDESGIVVGTSGRITDSTTSPKWTIDSTGISAQAGFFGGGSNNIRIDSFGLVLGTGSIVDYRGGAQTLRLDSTGLFAAAGNIGGLEITEEGIRALVTVEQTIIQQFYLTPDTIALTGDEALTINTGTMVVKDAGKTYIELGRLASSTYGMKVNLYDPDTGAATGKYIQLDQNGLRAFNGSINTINVDKNGSIAITGEINASTGTLGNLTVTGTITAGDTHITSSGISGTGYSLGASGFTATGGTIAGWTIGTSTISKGTLIIDSTNQKITTTGATFGQYAAGSYGIQATSGKIGGWTLAANALTTPNISIESNTELISIASEVLIGKYDAVTPKYGIKAGDVVLNSAGLSGTGYSLSSSGLVATTGSIGGWTINGTVIRNADSSFILDSANGALKLATDKIVLNKNGSATIGKLSVGTDGSITSDNFSISAAGSVAITGAITATSGTFTGTIHATSGWFGTSGSHVDVSGNGFVAGSVIIDNLGLRIGSSLSLDTNGLTIANGSNSSINLGGKFIANSAGITAIAGTIGGWTLGPTTITGGTVSLDSAGIIKVTKTGDATKYVQIDGTGLNVVGGLVNIVTGINGTDNVTISSTGIRAGGATNYATLSSTGLTVVGGGLNITTAVNGNASLSITSTGITAIPDSTKQGRVIMDATGVKVIKDDGSVGSAITQLGIIGQLITDQSIVGTKFDKVAPATPTGVSAAQVVEQTSTTEFINLNVSWNAVTDTDLDLAGYKVYLKEGSGGLYMPQAIVQKTLTQYTIRNVKGNTQYYIGVTSYDVTGNESARSTDYPILTTKDTIAPSPINVNSFTIVDGIKMFYLKWNPVTTNSNSSTCVDLDYYEVERYDGVTWSPVNKTYSTSIIDKDISYDVYYRYRIRSVDLSGNMSSWVEKDAGEPSRVSSADILAGSITAEVLNVGSMVKNINPNNTILFHYDGVMTSTQDLRPVSTSGGAWVNGKYGNGIALEEATVNLVSTATSGNSGFSNGTTGWTSSGAEYKSNGGASGSSDGYVEVNSTNKISIAITGLLASTSYTLSLYAKNALFNEPTDLVVKKDAVEIIRSSQRSDWARVKYTFSTGSSETSATFEFSSIDARKIGIDNIQLEQRDFMTAYAESYSLPGNIRAHGWTMYSSEKLNTKQGIVAFWFKPNRNGKSPNQTGRILFHWGNLNADHIALGIDDANKPYLEIKTGATTKKITHVNGIDSNDWNLIAGRWNCEPTTDDENKYMDITLNGDPTIEANRMSLVGFSSPSVAQSYFTVGNYADNTSYSANGYFDELRIDVTVKMDKQEQEEMIAWYKQGATFYDASSQIDADSQGISASNARIRINNEGITVTDGVIKVIADDGVTLIGGGRVNVNGMNVGVAQSDNEVYNGNFSSPDTYYGVGDMYISPDGIVGYGARYWRNRRSTAWTYDIALANASWNKYLINEVFDFQKIYDTLYSTYNTQIRASEAVTHAVETGVLSGLYASGVAAVTGTLTAVGASVVYASALLWLPGQQVYIDAGANRELMTILSVNPVGNAVTFTSTLTKAHNPGSTIVEKTLFDDTLEDELSYQINKATNSKYDEWINFGLSVERYNDANGNIKYVGIRTNPETKLLEYIPHSLNRWTNEFSVAIDPSTLLPLTYTATEEEGVFGHTKYEVWPKETLTGKTGYAKLGINPIHADLSVDTSAQFVSLEQDLNNLITYTDGFQAEGTNWRQHIFSFWAQWDNKPVGSQSELVCEVQELVPSYSVDSNNVATQIPSFQVTIPDVTIDQNHAILLNTDYAHQKYQLAFGHATYSNPDDYNSYKIDSVRYASILPMLKVRYIRDWTKGNTVDGNNTWCEVVAVDTLGNVVSVGKTVTGSVGLQNASSATDGNPLTLASIPGDGTPKYIQVDLGQTYNLGAIKTVHYVLDGRTFHGTKVQVSEDGIKWYDVWAANPLLPNCGYQYEYAETSQGWTIGGITGMTPNPIFVEEIFTPLGATDAGKPHWAIKTDGITENVGHAKYLSATQPGDTIMVAFSAESLLDTTIDVLKNPGSGIVYVYLDGVVIGEADTSYPVSVIEPFQYKNIPAGNHVSMLISTGEGGFNTTTEDANFKLGSVEMYDFKLLSSEYVTAVTYEETSPNSWNKVTIKPKKSNTKDSGTPRVTAEKVPIKYRVKVSLSKPAGDPFPCSVLVTDIQAELGENESFSRINYGVSGFPGYMVARYNPEIQYSGITTQHIQEHSASHIQETGIYERHIADYQITTKKLARSAVTAETIAAGNITYDKLAKTPKQKLGMNLSISDFKYPLIVTPNMNPAIRYIPSEIQEDTEEIFKNGQMLFKDEDYTISTIEASQHIVTLGVAASSGHTSTTIRLGVSASPLDDTYNGMRVIITGGTGAGQVKTITNYVGSTKDVTIDSPWAVTPNASSQYRIIDDVEYATKIELICSISATDKVWGDWWLPIA